MAKNNNFKKNLLRIIISFTIGFIVGFLVIFGYLELTNSSDETHPHDEDEFHTHADFLVSLNGEIYDFAKEEFMSDGINTKHDYVHLHDNNSEIIHYHQENITLGDFFTSLNMSISNESFSTQNQTFSTNQTHIFEVYVNEEKIENPQNYVANDIDQIVFAYYKQNSSIEYLFDNLTDEACIYSRECPERGEPPESSCLTGSGCAYEFD